MVVLSINLVVSNFYLKYIKLTLIKIVSFYIALINPNKF